jgi:hypothetical protein
MINLETTVKRTRGTDLCQRGHSRWGYVPKKKARYCLDCENLRAMRRDYLKNGQMGKKAVSLMESTIDFEISSLENQIADLVTKIVKLNNEKKSIREYYEKRIGERKKAK